MNDPQKPDSWEQALPAIVMVLTEGTPEGVEAAARSLRSMAAAADLLRAALGALDTLSDEYKGVVAEVLAPALAHYEDIISDVACPLQQPSQSQPRLP